MVIKILKHFIFYQKKADDSDKMHETIFLIEILFMLLKKNILADDAFSVLCKVWEHFQIVLQYLKTYYQGKMMIEV